MDYPESHTDRLLRLNYLKETVRTAANVYIFADQKEDFEIFALYIKEYCGEDIQAKRLLVDSIEELSTEDVVFLCLRDSEKCVHMINKLVQRGLSPLQVIPPACYFFPAIAEKKGFICSPLKEQMQFPFLATIDIVNACNLDCSTCGKNTEQETSEKMSFELFVKILDKLQLMGIRQIELYNYTEPFLHPEIYRFMYEVKRRGLTLGISSNLSLPNIPHLKDCVDLLTRGDWFIVTISGIQQSIYEINHKHGKIINVIQNMKKIKESSKSSLVRLRLLHFDYNETELSAAKILAKECETSFEWFTASHSPFDQDNNETSVKTRSHLYESTDMQSSALSSSVGVATATPPSSS